MGRRTCSEGRVSSPEGAGSDRMPGIGIGPSLAGGGSVPALRAMIAVNDREAEEESTEDHKLKINVDPNSAENYNPSIFDFESSLRFLHTLRAQPCRCWCPT